MQAVRSKGMQRLECVGRVRASLRDTLVTRGTIEAAPNMPSHTPRLPRTHIKFAAALSSTFQLSLYYFFFVSLHAHASRSPAFPHSLSKHPLSFFLVCKILLREKTSHVCQSHCCRCCCDSFRCSEYVFTNNLSPSHLLIS